MHQTSSNFHTGGPTDFSEIRGVGEPMELLSRFFCQCTIEKDSMEQGSTYHHHDLHTLTYVLIIQYIFFQIITPPICTTVSRLLSFPVQCYMVSISLSLRWLCAVYQYKVRHLCFPNVFIHCFNTVHSFSTLTCPCLPFS